MKLLENAKDWAWISGLTDLLESRYSVTLLRDRNP